MIVFLWGIALFVIAFILHVFLWRVRVPAKGGRAVAVLFLSVGLFSLFSWALSRHYGVVPAWAGPEVVPQYIHTFLVLFAITAAYVASYPAIEADSPTLLLLDVLIDGGTKGVSREDIYAALNDSILVQPRLDDLVASDLASVDDGVYRISPDGRRLVGLFVFFRRLLKAEKGG